MVNISNMSAWTLAAKAKIFINTSVNLEAIIYIYVYTSGVYVLFLGGEAG